MNGNGGGGGGDKRFTWYERGIGFAILSATAIFSFYNGVPWASKEQITFLLHRISQLEAQNLSQSTELQTDRVSQSRMEVEVARMQERLEALEQYVYPVRSGRPGRTRSGLPSP